jgi:hypothetical protein
MRKSLFAFVVIVLSLSTVPALAAPQQKADPAVEQKPAAKPAPKPAVKPAEKVGLARLDKDWPKWLTVSFVDRSRVDSVRPPATKDAPYDTYFINRFRLTAAVKATPWLSGTVQLQDSRVAGYATSPAPKSIRNPIDVRMAYVELGKKAAKGFSVTVGRQEVTFADGRLMASPDWGNVSRTYEAVRIAVYRPGVKVEAFGAAPVDVTPDAFSRAKYGERAFGTWLTFDRVKPFAYVEQYFLGKFNASATGETGSKGDQMVYTSGVRVGGPIGKTVAWEVDTAFQGGHSASDSLSAWGTHELVTWSIGKSAYKPKLGLEFNYATGDSNPKDGTKQTFDQLYASTHGKWGLGDNVGWKNMQQVAVKFEAMATAKLKINTALNYLQLATLNDAWYGSSGSKVVANKLASSRTLGWEPDIFGTYTFNKDLTIGLGVSVLLGGDFLKESTDVQRIWTPYVMWTYKF